MGDPYAEFGGQATPQQHDPYAEFGGQALQQQPAQPQGAFSRFWSGVKHGLGDNSDYPPSHGTLRHPDFADNPMIPGSGVYRDIKSGNYAGAAGRIAGPAVELATMFIGGRGAVGEVESPAAGILRNRIAVERNLASQPPFPRVSEGLPEVEALQPQATAKLQQAVTDYRQNTSPIAARQAQTAEPTPVKVGQLPKDTGNPYAGSRTPDMQMVDSTNIQKIGYHDSSNTLVMEFRNGRVYEYRNVPKEIYNKLVDSESQGSFFARNIKGRYQTNYRGTVLGNRKY